MTHAGSSRAACGEQLAEDSLTANLADVDCLPCRVRLGLRLDRGEPAAPTHPDHAGRPVFGQKAKTKK